MAITVIKVGGSLTNYPEDLKNLLNNLGIFAKNDPLLIVPGGGEFADTVRRLDTQFTLSNVASHQMAILAMDQYGLLLADLLPNSKVIRTLAEVKTVMDSGGLPIFLPSEYMFLEDPLENSWNVTSDSIALYIAHQLQAKKVLLVTDVDGIYKENSKHKNETELITQISPVTLTGWQNRTSVDKALPPLLQKWPIDCYVVNGIYPQRIDAILKSEKTLCTRII